MLDQVYEHGKTYLLNENDSMLSHHLAHSCASVGEAVDFGLVHMYTGVFQTSFFFIFLKKTHVCTDTVLVNHNPNKNKQVKPTFQQ